MALALHKMLLNLSVHVNWNQDVLKFGSLRRTLVTIQWAMVSMQELVQCFSTKALSRSGIPRKNWHWRWYQSWTLKPERLLFMNVFFRFDLLFLLLGRFGLRLSGHIHGQQWGAWYARPFQHWKRCGKEGACCHLSVWMWQTISSLVRSNPSRFEHCWWTVKTFNRICETGWCRRNMFQCWLVLGQRQFLEWKMGRTPGIDAVPSLKRELLALCLQWSVHFSGLNTDNEAVSHDSGLSGAERIGFNSADGLSPGTLQTCDVFHVQFKHFQYESCATHVRCFSPWVFTVCPALCHPWQLWTLNGFLVDSYLCHWAPVVVFSVAKPTAWKPGIDTLPSFNRELLAPCIQPPQHR